ncbi:MAG: tetratricopeptide repeat protein, partial [Elusimicrobiota bacterium]|nr:tetratricopeptide repeat protein [Elusimicrobiota bacterium]
KNVLAYHNRGAAYYDKKEYKKALDDFNIAVKLKPDYSSQLQPYIDKIKQKGY